MQVENGGISMKRYIVDLAKRPLTESEKLFSEENYNLFLRYTRIHKLDEEERDALIVPYLEVVKKYLTIQRLQQFKFPIILVHQLDAYRQRYYKRMKSERYMPEGGICSLNSPLNKNGEEEDEIGALIIGKSINAERMIIDQEVFKEFMDLIGKFSHGKQMKIVLYLLLEGYADTEIIKYIQMRFPDWEFTWEKFGLLMKQLRFAFKEARLDSRFCKTSACKVVYYDILEFALKEKIIKRQGAKLLYNNIVIGKGRDEGKRYLEENQSELNEIIDVLKTKYFMNLLED